MTFDHIESLAVAMDLCDVTPRLAVDDATYGLLANSKLASKSLLGGSSSGVVFANIPNLLVRQLSEPLPFPEALPSLTRAVQRGVGIASHEEVDRAEACRVIAAMTNEKVFWEISESEPICDAMCAHHRPSDADLPVASLEFTPRPFQAWVSVPGKRQIILKFCQFLLQEPKAGSLVAHSTALLWPWLQGRLSFARQRPTSILRDYPAISIRDFLWFLEVA